mmetsp:Transcript_11536/g.35273  ORF Transcript_11536/g.35273 Transcript_11536/m.35273 type:complete len:231 (+) Transcript_11536:81-773(+)
MAVPSRLSRWQHLGVRFQTTFCSHKRTDADKYRIAHRPQPKVPDTSKVTEWPRTGLYATNNALKIDDRLLEDAPDIVKKVLGLEMMTAGQLNRRKHRELVSQYAENDKYVYANIEAIVASLTARIETLKELCDLDVRRRDITIFNARHRLVWKRNRVLKLLKTKNYESFKHVCRSLKIRELLPPVHGDRMKVQATREQVPNVITDQKLRAWDRRIRRGQSMHEFPTYLSK